MTILSYTVHIPINNVTVKIRKHKQYETQQAANTAIKKLLKENYKRENALIYTDFQTHRTTLVTKHSSQ